MGQLDNVRESTVLPKCDLVVRIADFKKTKSSTQKLMYKVEFRVVEDGEGRFNNAPIFDQYVIGSDSDPDGEKNKTWVESPGARNMKRLFKKLGLDTSKDVDELIEMAEDQEVGISLSKFVEPDKRKKRSADGKVVEVDNEYAGQPRNRVVNFWTVGEKSPQIFPDEEDAGESAAPAAASAAPAKDTAKATAPSAKKTTAPVIEDEPVRKAAPAKAAEAPAAAKGNGADAPAKVEKELPCPECEEMVPRSQFGKHIAEAHA